MKIPESGRFELKGEPTIPDLHNSIKGVIEGKTLRKHIQEQNDSSKPEWGIDANRDIYLSLFSSQRFFEFMEIITGNVDNISVFMMHGYSGYSSPGDVYGSYKIENDVAVMPPIIKKYVNYIRGHLFGVTYISSPNNTDGGFFYESKYTLPKKYAGEWSRHLYGEQGGKGIPSFDIELPFSIYNEGVQNDTPTYSPDKVGNIYYPFFADDQGRIINEGNSFYALLKDYFVQRRK
ncbi:hypothetical protein AGMMS49579_27140 [Spirochaetia bacterium]|nr:hypothetical protein AGMMS49579_27140 [Spirochaetia bacterium]